MSSRGPLSRSEGGQRGLADQPVSARLAQLDDIEEGIMHYPRRISRIKKLRKQGFRARMQTSKGRRLLNRQRSKGRHSLSVMI